MDRKIREKFLERFTRMRPPGPTIDDVPFLRNIGEVRSEDSFSVYSQFSDEVDLIDFVVGLEQMRMRMLHDYLDKLEERDGRMGDEVEGR